MADGFNTDDMLDSYLLENQQLLETLQQIVLEQKDEDCFDEEAIHQMFRIMHTIKGSSGFMMFDAITLVAHKLEDVFYVIRESHPKKVPHLELVEHILAVLDFFSVELEKIQSGELADGRPDEILNRLDAFLEQLKAEVEAEKQQEIPTAGDSVQKFYIAPVAAKTNNYFRITLRYREGISLINRRAYKTALALEEIAEEVLYFPEDLISDESCVEEIQKNGFQILLQTKRREAELWEFFQKGYEVCSVEIESCTEAEYEQGFGDSLEEPFFFIDLDSSIEEIEARAERTQEQIMSETKKMDLAPGDFVIQPKDLGKTKKLIRTAQKMADKTSYINVDVTKMNQLMDLMSELQKVELDETATRIKGLFQELQSCVLSMRMVSLESTFQKMNRMVFDLSRKQDKDIALVMEGENTELDRNIVEHIVDPLMHLVRNAVDHGIEAPIERLIVGKAEKATITLSAKTEADFVLISVSDDGKGLDRQKILEKAKSQGILDKNKSVDDYSDEEVFQLITAPGFSTKEQVTEYSGRGVGLDVVLSNIAFIGGNLEIESKRGRGSTMTMKIPLTYAVVDGIVTKIR